MQRLENTHFEAGLRGNLSGSSFGDLAQTQHLFGMGPAEKQHGIHQLSVPLAGRTSFRPLFPVVINFPNVDCAINDIFELVD